MVPQFHHEPVNYPLSVVVLSHNRLDELGRNLPDLIRTCADLHYELVVVDNASRPEVRTYLSQIAGAHPHVVLLQNEDNPGVAGGRNTAYAQVSGEFILSIDDDTRIAAGLLQKLPGLMRGQYAQTGILALRVLHAETLDDQNLYGEEECRVGNHHGAACVIRREVLSRVGGIDDYCTFGSEEIDLCIRAHAAGYEIRYAPALLAYHNNVLRQGGGYIDRVKKRVFNNARTMHKYFPLPMATVYSNRYLGMMSLSLILKKDLSSICALIGASLRGRFVGLRHRTPVPAATAAYYSDPALKPEFGNRPFFRKRAQNLFRKRGSSPAVDRP